MKTALHPGKHSEQGSILAYFIIVVLAVTALVSVSAYVAQSARVAHRRSDMIAARQYARIDPCSLFFPGSNAVFITIYDGF